MPKGGYHYFDCFGKLYSSRHIDKKNVFNATLGVELNMAGKFLAPDKSMKELHDYLDKRQKEYERELKR